MQTITVDIEQLPQGDRSDRLAAELHAAFTGLAGSVGEIKAERYASSMRVRAEHVSPTPVHIQHFAERMQVLARDTDTMLALTVSSPTGRSMGGSLAGLLGSIPTDGHVFHIHPAGDMAHLQAFLQAMLSAGAP